jgi:hypothetical protein
MGIIRARWAVALFLGLAGAGFIGCGSSGSGSAGPGKDAGPDAAKKCVVASDCDDDNPCTLESCESGACSSEVAPDGDAKDQEKGDCRRTMCLAGKASYVVDNGDVPDDKEPCTLDACEGGAPKHVAVVDGKACQIGTGTGTCEIGKCWVLCTPSNAETQCNDANSCTSDACLPCSAPQCKGFGECGHQGLSGMPTPGASQTTGDCREQRCVEGEDTDAEDNFDLPVDGNDCTDDVCKNGEPANPPLAAGTKCTANGGMQCDGSGKCVECVKDSDCTTSSSSNCYVAACEQGSCSTAPVPAGTPLPATQQTSGDCRTMVCDGSGGATYQEDSSDVPVDSNPCTKDECIGTTPYNTNLPAGTSCGSNGEICTSSGSCCTPTTCAQAGKTCGTTSNGCGTTLNCGTCPSGQTCTSAGQCCTPKTCITGKSCGSQSDGCGGTIQCGTCAAGDTCSGGTCGCANGFKGGSETDVDCGGFCGPCGQGLGCLASSDCTTGYCADGVCCNAVCTGQCHACTSAKTGLATGTCGNIKDGTDPDNECPNAVASTCLTSGMCQSGACAYWPSGTVCGAASCTGSTASPADTCSGSGTCVDGGQVACGGTYVCSGTTCQSCSDGLKNGTEVDVDCGGGGSCGKCGNGKKCLAASDCTSGSCVDGVCCNTACNGLCQRCNAAGSVGTCSFIPDGQDPDNECPGNNVCNGAGGCK